MTPGQLYISCIPTDSALSLETLNTTFTGILSWMNLNRLLLNPSKTEFLLIRIRIYLCFRIFMKSKSLLQIDLHAFVLNIMNVNLLFFVIYFIYFILICSVHFSAFVANKDIY